MANRHVKIFTLLIIREKQIKTPNKLSPHIPGKINNPQKVNKQWRACREKRTLHCSWGCKLVQPIMENSMQVS